MFDEMKLLCSMTVASFGIFLLWPYKYRRKFFVQWTLCVMHVQSSTLTGAVSMTSPLWVSYEFSFLPCYQRTYSSIIMALLKFIGFFKEQRTQKDWTLTFLQVFTANMQILAWCICLMWIPIFQELPNLEWSIVIFFPDLYLKWVLHSSNGKLN